MSHPFARAIRGLRVRRSPERRPTLFSLIDVGSDTVKVAVVSTEAGRPRVLGLGLAASQGYDLSGGRREAAALTAATNEALTQAEDETENLLGRKVVPDDAVFVIPNRATETELVTVHQARPRPRAPISKGEVAAMWERAGRLSRERLGRFSAGEGGLQPLAITSAGLWVDNHLVSEAEGLPGRELVFSVFAVAVKSPVLRAIERIAQRLELAIFNLAAASQALTAAIPRREAVVVDVGASGADCYLLRHNSLVAAGRAPYGGAFFTQALEQAFRVDKVAAEALKVAYGTEALSGEDTLLVERGLQPALIHWRKAMAAVLRQGASEQPLPGHFYFVGGGSFLPGLQRGLLAWLSTQTDLVFARAPEIETLDDALLPGLPAAPGGPRRVLFALALSVVARL